MTILGCLEKENFLENIDLDYGTYACIRIGFEDDKGRDDETEFDIVLKDMLKDNGQELSDLFDTFCEENKFKSNTVEWIEIVAQADSKKELEKIS